MPKAFAVGGNDATQVERKQQIYAEQIRLLYANSNASIAVTASVASVLSYLQWAVISHEVVLLWLMYMLAASGLRFAIARRYRAAAPAASRTRPWGSGFTAGTALAAAGWGAAGILLYPAHNLAHQVLLAFVLGGMMLGAGSILAARPEAFVGFTLPTGLPIAVRFFLGADDVHRAMAFLAIVFIVATLLTTWRIYVTVGSSLALQFENRDLVAELRNANEQAATLNRELELRVEQRTAELRDINERLRSEIDRQQRMEEELVRARNLEALGVLAGGIAHDFNNFLTVLQGNIGLAKLDLDPQHPAYEILDRITAACDRAAALAGQLMTFAKGGAPVRRTTSIARLIRDAVELARAGANVSFDVEIDHELDPAEVDAAQVGHALQNILINARQAMPQGGVIEVRAGNVALDAGSIPLKPGRYIRIEIRDQGCGIAPENLPRVFDPYFTTKPTGTGLGLAAAHSIVSKHHGHITVESSEGSGTTFYVYLPSARESPVPEQPPEERPKSGSGRILIMDDEEAVRTALADVLTRLGYEVTSAADGAEAVALCVNERAAGRGFDAAVLDLTVPGGMGGVEAAARLKQIDPSLKLIASSGYSDAAVMSDVASHAFDDALPKPWTPSRLSEVLRKVLS